MRSINKKLSKVSKLRFLGVHSLENDVFINETPMKPHSLLQLDA
jgi:hypothetical protein